MLTLRPINDNNLLPFNRLATMTCDRHTLPPPEQLRHENMGTVEDQLEADIMGLHSRMNRSDGPCCPERAVAFSLEYVPWADHKGEHDYILTATIVGEIDQDVGLALIAHIVATGTPRPTPGELIHATGLERHIWRRTGWGFLLGVTLMMAAQLIIPLF